MAELSQLHQNILKQYRTEIQGRNIENLRHMKTLLNTIYTDARNQITENTAYRPGDERISTGRYLTALKARREELHYTFTIYFPEFVISNTQGRSRTIKDLFVRFFMNADLKLISVLDINGYESFLSGLRTSYTPEEWVADYAHSHLPGKTDEGFLKFCTGSGPINQIIARLGSQYRPVDFNMFLHTINNYVKHESIEGRPHRLMENISVSETPLPNVTITPNNISKFTDLTFQTFLTEYKSLNFTVDESKIDVTIPVEYDIKIAEIIRQNYSRPEFQPLFQGAALDTLTPFKTSDGRYCLRIVNQQIPSYSSRLLLDFKGQPKRLYIGYDNNNTNDGTGVHIRYTHPQFLELLRKQYSRILTTSAIKIQNPGW